MTTYSKETALYDTGAIADDITSAGQTATSYITTVTSDGIMVADAGSGTTGGAITSNTTGWHIGGVLEFIRQGVSRFWIGLKNQGDTTPTVRIGKEYDANANDNESHMELDYHSLQLVDKEGNTYFHVSDLRGTDGYATVSDRFKPKTADDTFTVQYPVRSKATTSATVNGSSVTVASVQSQTVTLSNAVSAGSNVVITYQTSSVDVKAYTLGARDSGGVGGYSVVEGYHCIASGPFSHAEGGYNTAAEVAAHAEGVSTTASGYAAHSEGLDTVASGYASHAQNNDTIAASDNQTAIGKYNVEDNADTYALIIGNGTADSARKNAATIDWNGNYMAQAMAGVIQMFAGSTLPSGWLMCDGSAVSRTTYATLFAAIGTTWGTGDGSTTFNLPDLRGRAPIGAGAGTGLTSRTLGTQNIGAETHTLTSGQIPAHSHAFPYPTFGGESGKLHYETGGAISGTGNKYAYIDGGSSNQYPSATNNNTGGGGSHNNMQPSAVVNFIICTGKTS